jgi:hypothetical protein
MLAVGRQVLGSASFTNNAEMMPIRPTAGSNIDVLQTEFGEFHDPQAYLAFTRTSAVA